MTTKHSPFSPTTLGAIDVANRFAMAPMTRARTPDRVPAELSVEYYAQRAGTGLIITEATQVSVQGTGSIATPGIHSAEQIAGWKKVTDAVHARGGKIICQIWHVGRVSHVSFQKGGQPPVSSSANRGNVKTFTAQGYTPTSEPRALEISEIPGVVEQYRQGAINAIEAGFDGVQIHAASGYLIDQFLRDGVNQRDDAYGGSVENRCRFLLEVTDAVCATIGSERTSVRLSPFTVTWDCKDSNPAPLFKHAVSELNQRQLGFLEIVERGFDSIAVSNAQVKPEDGFTSKDLRERFDGPLMVNGCYDLESATAVIESGFAQMVAIGRPFISTPDLVERYRAGAPLNDELNPIAWYGGGAEGFTDQPSLADLEQRAAHA